MSNASTSPRLKARLAGLCYLLTIGVGALDHLAIGRGVVIAGNAVQTAHNLLAAEPVYRLAFTLDLLPVGLAAVLAGPTLALGSLGEVVLTLWLVIFGVDAAKWRQRAS